MSLREAAITVVLFLVLLNASAVAMNESGLSDNLGVNPNPGGDDEISSANESARNISATGGIGQTLFGALAAVADTFNSIGELIFAGPRMFINLGVPEYIVTFVFAPAYIIVGIAVADILTGRFG